MPRWHCAEPEPFYSRGAELDFPERQQDWYACQMKAYDEMENREAVRARLLKWNLPAKLQLGRRYIERVQASLS